MRRGGDHGTPVRNPATVTLWEWACTIPVAAERPSGRTATGVVVPAMPTVAGTGVTAIYAILVRGSISQRRRTGTRDNATHSAMPTSAISSASLSPAQSVLHREFTRGRDVTGRPSEDTRRPDRSRGTTLCPRRPTRRSRRRRCEHSTRYALQDRSRPCASGLRAPRRRGAPCRPRASLLDC